jgi:hypothetical protein
MLNRTKNKDFLLSESEFFYLKHKSVSRTGDKFIEN